MKCGTQLSNVPKWGCCNTGFCLALWNVVRGKCEGFLGLFLLTLGQKYFLICALNSDCVIFKVLFYGVGRRTGLICGLMAA